jgi:hypothetical protein
VCGRPRFDFRPPSRATVLSSCGTSKFKALRPFFSLFQIE